MRDKFLLLAKRYVGELGVIKWLKKCQNLATYLPWCTKNEAKNNQRINHPAIFADACPQGRPSFTPVSAKGGQLLILFFFRNLPIVKSRAVDRSTIQFWTLWAKGHSTLPAEMFWGSDFWLEPRVIIKISTYPC